MVLSCGGHCHVVRLNADGSRELLRELGAGKSFGESLSFSLIKASPISILAATNCTVIFVPTTKIITDINKFFGFDVTIIENLIRLLAQKCIVLHIKNDILSKRTIREKLMYYFEYRSDETTSTTFNIPFKREELADYLGVNRSAMVRELGKMQRENLIAFNKNTFTLKSQVSECRFKN